LSFGDFRTASGIDDDSDLSRERERTMRSGNPFGAGDSLVSMALDDYAPSQDCRS